MFLALKNSAAVGYKNPVKIELLKGARFSKVPVTYRAG